MKRLLLLTCLLLAGFIQRAKAQWTVIDPSNLAQNITSAVKSSTTASNMIKSLQESIKIYNQEEKKQLRDITKEARKISCAEIADNVYGLTLYRSKNSNRYLKC